MSEGEIMLVFVCAMLGTVAGTVIGQSIIHWLERR